MRKCMCYLLLYATALTATQADDRTSDLIIDSKGGCRKIKASAMQYQDAKGLYEVPLFAMEGKPVSHDALKHVKGFKASGNTYNLCVNFAKKNGTKTLKEFLSFYGRTLLKHTKIPTTLLPEGDNLLIEFDFNYEGRFGCLEVDVRDVVNTSPVEKVGDIKISGKSGYFVYEIAMDVKCQNGK